MSKRNNFDYNKFIIRNLLCLVALCVLAGSFLVLKKDSFAESLTIEETLPYYSVTSQSTTPLKINTNVTEPQEGDTEAGISEPVYTSLIGDEDIIYQPETDETLTKDPVKLSLTLEDVEKLKDLSYLKNNFYIVDSKTNVSEEYFNVDEFLSADLTIDNTVPGPKVLIIHTHSTEGFIDSDMSDPYNGIMGVGDKLADILTNEYGIETMQCTERADIVNGVGQILGAYERIEPVVESILEEYPSIQMVIDIHRDGVLDDSKRLTTIDGVDYAQVMFFNGLCQLNKNGELTPIAGLPNPYLKQNLALSFNMQLLANKLYPTFTKKIYLNAYRYTLHMMPNSMLVEVGTQNNTFEEAMNSMDLLGELIADTIK